MSLSFCVLGSGSGGNCTVVFCDGEAERQCFLIDCGLSPRQTNRRLAASGLGITIADVKAIVLTHFDTDHFYPGWVKPIRTFNLPVHVHRRHRSAAWRAGLTARHASLFTDSVALDCGVSAQSTLLAHDDLGSVGYVFEHAGLRLGYATDLGCVPKSLIDLFSNVDALALESNYDRDMQLNSRRPIFLKRRIMGGNGHLSNEQSLEAVYELAGRSGLSQIALLHLSRECNCPKLLRTLWAKEAPHLLERLTITNQFEPSPLLQIRKIGKPGKQPSRRSKPGAFVEPHDHLPLFAQLGG